MPDGQNERHLLTTKLKLIALTGTWWLIATTIVSYNHVLGFPHFVFVQMPFKGALFCGQNNVPTEYVCYCFDELSDLHACVSFISLYFAA